MMRFRHFVIFAVAMLVLAACASDQDARQDLPVDAQTNDLSEMDVAVMADGFPNVGHKCVQYAAGPPVGMFTTTDRTVILIYNDWACEGANVEQPMNVINAVPRAVVNASG